MLASDHGGPRRAITLAAVLAQSRGACLALALLAGLPNAVGAAAIEVIGVTSGPLSNTGTLDYILLDTDGTANATVTGDVVNAATGTIDGTDFNAGVGVYNGSTITGALRNRGRIGAASLANYAIEIRDSAIDAGVYNETGAELASAAAAMLIDLSSGSFTGGIGNAGGIIAGSEGIDFAGESLSGGIANSGSIASGLTGIEVSISAGATGDGSLSGGIANSGSITSDGNAAIRVYADALTGGVSNVGAISAANDAGIDLQIGTIADGLTNAGTIASGGDGFAVQGDAVDGGFTNGAAGSITSSNADAVRLSVSAFAGGIYNAGSLAATAGNALSVNDGSYGGGVTNAGAIQAESGGIAIGSDGTVAGEIRNEAGASIGAGVGIDLAGGSEAAGIVNAGGITAQVSLSVPTDAVSGAVVNTGTMTGDLWLAGSNAAGDGIDLTNSGSIDLGVPAVYDSLVSGDFTQTGSGSLAMTVLTFSDYAGLPPLTVLGSVEIAGDLLLSFDPTFGWEPFARLTLIAVGGTRSGLFDNYADNALVQGFGGRQAVYIRYTDGGDIELYTTPVPPTWLLIGLGLLGWRRLQRRGFV
jgi:hypothetical protein